MLVDFLELLLSNRSTFAVIIVKSK